MHMFKKDIYRFFLLLISLMLPGIAFCATPQEEVDVFYACFITGDMDRWLQEMEALEAAFYNEENAAVLKDLIVARYGYIGWALENDRDAAKKLLPEAMEEADLFLEKHPRDPDMLALKAALYGFQMALRPLLAPVKGPRSLRLMDEALEIDPGHPQALLQKANAGYYMPGILGGSKTAAIEKYVQAARAWEKEGLDRYNWQYLNLLAATAQAYQATEQWEKAYQLYTEILKKEARFAWVRDDLFPTFMKLYSQKESK